MAKRGRGSRRSTLDTTRILPSVCLFFFFSFFFVFFLSFFLFDSDSFISLFSSFLFLYFFLSFFLSSPPFILSRRTIIFSHDSTRFLTGFLTKISNYSEEVRPRESGGSNFLHLLVKIFIRAGYIVTCNYQNRDETLDGTIWKLLETRREVRRNCPRPQTWDKIFFVTFREKL